MLSGRITWWVLVIGLATMGILLFIPGMGLNAIYAAIITPILAAVATSLELLLHGKKAESASLFSAVALVIFVAFWSAQ